MGKKILGWIMVVLGVILLIAKLGFGITGILIWFGIFFLIGTGFSFIRNKESN